MKKQIAVWIFAAFLLNPLYAYRYAYAEQYYRLYRRNLHHYPEAIMANINYLMAARSAPFANPLYALAKIETETEWKYYQALFFMHINLLLVKEHLNLAARFDKYNAYFYNAPWRSRNLASLQTAQKYYQMALDFWPEVLRWAEQAGRSEYRRLELKRIAAWQTELARINDKSIDYEAIIARDLERLEQVRARFQAMNQNTY